VESCTVHSAVDFGTYSGIQNVQFSFSSFCILFLYYYYFLCLHWEVGFVSFSSLHLRRPALPPLFTVNKDIMRGKSGKQSKSYKETKRKPSENLLT